MRGMGWRDDGMISIIFWGSTILSLITALIAIIYGKWRFMIASTILYYPFSWYLNATPRFQGALLLLIFHFLIAYFVFTKKYQLIWLAWVSIIPITAFPVWIAIMVWNQ